MSTASDAAAEAARGNTFKGTQVTVRGDRAVYTVHVPGAPNALDPEVPPTTLFFIHGFGGSCEQFDDQIADMSAQGYHVVAFDLLGHGQSARPKDELAYTTSALAEDCLYLFNKYRTARNVLIGHSYGSALAVFMASEIKDLAALVLISTSSNSPIPSTTLEWTPTFVFAGMRAVLGIGGERSLAVSRMVHATASPDVRRKQMAIGRANDSGVLRATGSHALWPMRAHFEAVPCPVLLIHGRDDELTTVRSAEPLRKWLINMHDWVIVEQAGHNVMMERPQQVSEALATFFTELQHLEEQHGFVPSEEALQASELS